VSNKFNYQENTMNHDERNASSGAASKKTIPWPFILILAVVIIPVVAAYVAYYTGMGVSDETVNKGILLQPPVHLDQLTDVADEVPELEERKWRLLLPLLAPCTDTCAENLYTTRQVHIRLGEKAERVERLAVNLGGAAGQEQLDAIQADHPRLKHFSVSREQWQHWLNGTNVPASLEQDHYYLLVDQEGYAMMFYTAAHHGNELLDDIKRVLRYTPE
jgi:hypothetical protein